MRGMPRRLVAIMRKELIHILRDFRSLMIVLLMPVLMIALYGYGITLDMRNIDFAVVDDSHTPESRALIDAFRRNGFFHFAGYAGAASAAEEIFRSRNAKMVLVIPRDFAQALRTGPSVKVQVLVDATDSNVGTYVGTYAANVFRLFNQSQGIVQASLATVEPKILYNPDMKSTHFFVPGLIALLLMLTSALLTSITITREKESGTMEQILVSPIHPVEIIIGKVLPYVLIGMANGALIVVSAMALFGTPVVGSPLLLLVLSVVYIFVALSFGLLISTIAKSQQIAMLMTVMSTILPTFLMSGFLFPIASMPAPLQLVSRALPATYYLVIIRGIMLKGVGISDILPETLALAGIGAGILAIAIKRFKVTLD